MEIKSGIDKILYSIADLKCRLNIEIKPLVKPHPKHDISKIFFTGQKVILNILEEKYKKTKKPNPTHTECKVCLFLFDASLYLRQRLSITISKSA